VPKSILKSGRIKEMNNKFQIKTTKAADTLRKLYLPTMITTFGMKDGMYSDQIIAKIDMDALF
jgi:hypothetical protein